QVFGVRFVHLAAADPEMKAATGGRAAPDQSRGSGEVGRIEGQGGAGNTKAGWRGQVRHRAYLAGFDQQADPGPFLAVDRDVDEGGDADQVQSARGHVAPGDGDR